MGVTAVARPPLLANSVAQRFDSVVVGAHGHFSALELRYPFLTFSAAGSGYLLSSQAVCLFLSLLLLTWIDYSLNSAIILSQSCIRDPRPWGWFVFTYILGFNYSTSLKSATGIWLRHSLTLFNNYLHLEVQTGRLVGPSLSLHSLSSMWALSLHGCRWDYCGRAAGAGFSYGEIGCANAYHIVAVNTKDRRLSCFKWGSAFHVNKVLPFWSQVSSIYLHMYSRLSGLGGQAKLRCHLPDALPWWLSPSCSSVCRHNLEMSIDCFSTLGIPLHPDKQEGPSTWRAFLCTYLIG